MSIDEQLMALLRHLPALREAGVTSIKVDGLEATLGAAPLPVTAAEDEQSPLQAQHDVLDLRPGELMALLRSRKAP